MGPKIDPKWGHAAKVGKCSAAKVEHAAKVGCAGQQKWTMQQKLKNAAKVAKMQQKLNLAEASEIIRTRATQIGSGGKCYVNGN